jgi:benzoyl-CoA reductase/2-hydroxyglutaryl-CoA dehydratase subunit BcrC/BadD/HgdB
MNLFEILYSAAFALDDATESDLREAQAELERRWNEGGKTQEEMDAQCRLRGILFRELNGE